MQADIQGNDCMLEWKAAEGSKYFQSPKIYKDNGFLQEADADEFLTFLQENPEEQPIVEKIEKKKETKNPPFCIIWRNCKTTAQSFLRSALMKRCGLHRSFTRKN